MLFSHTTFRTLLSVRSTSDLSAVNTHSYPALEFKNTGDTSIHRSDPSWDQYHRRHWEQVLGQRPLPLAKPVAAHRGG